MNRRPPGIRPAGGRRPAEAAAVAAMLLAAVSSWGLAGRPARAMAARAAAWGPGGAAGCLAPPSTAVPPRPGLPDTLGSTHVLAHFDAAVVDSSYVRGVLEAAERARRVLVDTLGCRAPALDGGAGGDDRTDVYVGPIGGAPLGVAGATWPEAPTGDPIYPASYSAWFQVVETLADSIRDVVTAHEYFHAIQMAYDRDDALSVYEMLSTWAEERVFPAVDAYRRVLPPFFAQPERALFAFTYSNVPWAFFLTERYGDAFVADLLDAMGRTPGNPPGALRAAHDAALAARGGGDFFSELVQFRVWNLFTGARDDGEHYREGALWPEVRIERRLACVPAPLASDVHLAGSYGALVHVVEGDHAHGTLRIPVRPEIANRIDASITRFCGGASFTTTRSWPPGTAPTDTLEILSWEDVDSVAVVVSNFRGAGSLALAGFAIGAAHGRVTPPSGGWVLVLDRDACRRPFDGAGGRLGPREGQERAFSIALGELGVAFVQSDSIPLDLSTCLGVFLCGGQDDAGLRLDDAELDRLRAFVDGGGDVYLESRTFGAFAGAASASAVARAFWDRFGTVWRPPDSTSVSAWNTVPGSPLGARAFAYGGAGAAGAGILEPVAAETLAVDALGRVRATMRRQGASVRIHATVLLGASGDAASRRGWVAAVLSAWDALVPVLGVRGATLSARDGVVTLEGTLGGWSGETVDVVRDPDTAPVPVAVDVSPVPGGARFVARDVPPRGRHAYAVRLVGTAGARRELWRGVVDAGLDAPRLVLGRPAPNPVRDRLRVDVRSSGGPLAVTVYDVAGRRVLSRRLDVPPGRSRVELDLAGERRPAPGVYFVRVRGASGAVAVRRFLVLR